MANENVKVLKARTRQKHDIEANWIKAGNAEVPFVPLAGELIIYDKEVLENGSVTELPVGRTVPYTYSRFKIGDGFTNVTQLRFADSEFTHSCRISGTASESLEQIIAIHIGITDSYEVNKNSLFDLCLMGLDSYGYWKVYGWGGHYSGEDGAHQITEILRSSDIVLCPHLSTYTDGSTVYCTYYITMSSYSVGDDARVYLKESELADDRIVNFWAEYVDELPDFSNEPDGNSYSMCIKTPVEVVQETGTSETAVMSQKATTEASQAATELARKALTAGTIVRLADKVLVDISTEAFNSVTGAPLEYKKLHLGSYRVFGTNPSFKLSIYDSENNNIGEQSISIFGSDDAGDEINNLIVELTPNGIVTTFNTELWAYGEPFYTGSVRHTFNEVTRLSEADRGTLEILDANAIYKINLADDTGDNPAIGMSQKATTDAINNVKNKVANLSRKDIVDFAYTHYAECEFDEYELGHKGIKVTISYETTGDWLKDITDFDLYLRLADGLNWYHITGEGSHTGGIDSLHTATIYDYDCLVDHLTGTATSCSYYFWLENHMPGTYKVYINDTGITESRIVGIQAEPINELPTFEEDEYTIQKYKTVNAEEYEELKQKASNAISSDTSHNIQTPSNSTAGRGYTVTGIVIEQSDGSQTIIRKGEDGSSLGGTVVGYELVTTEGLEIGMKGVSVRLGLAKYNFGSIKNVFGDSKIVLINGAPNNIRKLNNKNNDLAAGSVYNVLTIMERPDLGDTPVSFYATAFGVGAVANEYGAVALGNNTHALGKHSFATGRNTVAGFDAFAQGWNSQALGDQSFASGHTTKAYANSSHTEGYHTETHGYASHAGGEDSITFGSHSLAHGHVAYASGNKSIALGDHVEAAGDASVALGAYNEPYIDRNTSDETYLLSLGNGTGEEALSNAFAITRQGSLKAGAVGSGNLGIATIGQLQSYCNIINKKSSDLPYTFNIITISTDRGTGIKINGLTGTMPEKLEIPGAINNIPVLEIGYDAFKDNTTITELIVCEGITTIYDRAFANCTNLKSIKLPDSLKVMGVNVFSGCTNLTKVFLPKNLEILGGQAFSGCPIDNTVVIPQSCLRVGTKVDGTATSSGKNVFTSDKIPAIVFEGIPTHIRYNAFTGCKCNIYVPWTSGTVTDESKKWGSSGSVVFQHGPHQPISVLQETGNSTTATMSQKCITEELGNLAEELNQVTGGLDNLTEELNQTTGWLNDLGSELDRLTNVTTELTPIVDELTDTYNFSIKLPDTDRFQCAFTYELINPDRGKCGREEITIFGDSWIDDRTDGAGVYPQGRRWNIHVVKSGENLLSFEPRTYCYGAEWPGTYFPKDGAYKIFIEPSDISYYSEQKFTWHFSNAINLDDDYNLIRVDVEPEIINEDFSSYDFSYADQCGHYEELEVTDNTTDGLKDRVAALEAKVAALLGQ